jgi:UrcA family protein
MKIAIILAGCLAAATQAHAADNGQVLREDVYIGDLRQDTPGGLATLYARVQAAAQRVCQPLESRDRLHSGFSKCKREAIERATAQIPALANYAPKKHKTRNG